MIYFNKSEVLKNLVYSIVRTETIVGGIQCVATSFFITKNNNIFLLTNRHVLNDADIISFEMHHSFFDTSKTTRISFSKEQLRKHQLYYFDPRVDLCLINFESLLSNCNLDISNYSFFAYPFSFEEIDKKEMIYIEDVVTIGYPKGIEDEINKIGIFRMCHTATHPQKDYMGKLSFLIDGNIYQGCSGSPVFLFNDNLRDEMPVLIGIVSGGLMVNGNDTKLTECVSYKAINLLIDLFQKTTPKK